MNDDGFTLVELLVALVVLGILATISVLRFIDFREDAELVSLEEDMRSMAGAVEAWTSTEGHHLQELNGSDQSLPALTSQGLRTSQDVTLKITVTGADYCISGKHAKVPSSEVRFRRSTGRVEVGPAGTLNC